MGETRRNKCGKYDAPSNAIGKMSSDLKGQHAIGIVLSGKGVLGLDGIQQQGLVATGELDVDDGTHNL